MIESISTGILIAVAVIAVFGFLRGFFKGTFRSLMDIAFLALNIILSLIIASIIAKNIVNVEIFAEYLPKIAPTLGISDELVNEVNTYLTSPELASTSAKLLIALMSIIVMPLVFMVVYIVLGIILFIPKIIIQLVLFSKSKGIGLRLGGGAIGLVTKVVGFAVLIIPLVGYLNYAKNTLDLINDNEEQPRVEVGVVGEYIDGIAETPVIRTVYAFGGEALFNKLTTSKIDGITVSLRNETKCGVEIYKEIDHFKGVAPEDYGKEQTDSIGRIETIINDAEFVPALVANTLSYVATEWNNGNKVFGFEKPVIGTELQSALDAIIRVLSGTTTDTFKADVCTVAEIFVCAIDDGMIKAALKEDGDILYVLENTDFISHVLVELHKNDRMRVILPYVTNGIVNYIYGIYDEVNGTTTEKHEMIDINSLSEEKVKQEGQILSDVVVDVDIFLKSIEGKLDGENIIDLLKYGDFGALGRAFNGIKKSYLFCDIYEFLLKTVLESKGCSQLGILDEQFIKNALSHDSDMEMMLVARQKVALIVISMYEDEDIDYDDAISMLISNVASGDAESIKSIVSEENLQGLGIGKQSAHTISGLLTSMINSIQNDEVEITEEEKEKESESAGKIVLAVNSAIGNNGSEKNVFIPSDETDTTEATSNMTASEFVSTTLDSKLVSSMVVEATKDEDGNEVDDPYNIKSHLSENDKKELENALAEEYSKTDENDEERKEKIAAIAHIFGIDTTNIF